MKSSTILSKAFQAEIEVSSLKKKKKKKLLFKFLNTV